MAIHAQFEHSSLSVTGTEHFLQPPEAAVWARAAFVWRVHHRHWSGPLLQVGSWKYCTCTASMLHCSIGHEVMPGGKFSCSRWVLAFFWLPLHILRIRFVCLLLRSVDLIDCPPSHLFVFTQKENNVPKHCKCHGANGGREGGHCFHLQQPHQEGNCHVCNLVKKMLS